MKDARGIALSLLKDAIAQDDDSFSTPYTSPEYAIQFNAGRVFRRPIQNKVAKSRDYLVWMCVRVILDGHLWEVDKQHRWVAFVQRGLLEFDDPEGFDGVERECDRVRNAPDWEPSVQ